MAHRKTEPAVAPGEINAEDYLMAAKNHTAALSALYQRGDYALTIYVSGLAAECLFRAFRARRNLPFRPDHPLSELAREAGFPDFLPDDQRTRADTVLNDLIVRWRNNHRFRSNDALRRFLKKYRLDRGIKGDFLKENARLLSSGTIELIYAGVEQWRS